MPLPTVKEFLFCIDLKVGCLFIGYLTALVNSIFAIYMVAGLIIAYFEILEDFEFPVSALLLISILFLILPVIGVYISVLFIKGVQSRDPVRISYFMILLIIEVIFSIYAAAENFSITWIINGIVISYFFVCVYSLHQIYKTPESYEKPPSYSGVTGNASDMGGDAGYQEQWGN